MLTILKKILKFTARATIKKYDPCIIGITGNVGKTSVKEAVLNFVKYERKTRGASKNFNNELGLPLSIIGEFGSPNGVIFWIKVIIKGIFQLIKRNDAFPEVLVLEYGIDRPGDMKYLLEIAHPHIGVFTALGDVPVHIEFFSGQESVLREKGKLISSLPSTGFAILNADDDLVLSSKELTRSHVITYGFSPKAHVRITNFKYFVDDETIGVSFKLSYGGSVVPFKVSGSLGKSSAQSIAAATTIGLLFGANLSGASEVFSEFLPPKGRKRILRGVKHSLIVDDTYNAAPLSMDEALDVLSSIPAKRKIAVLGDMLELGSYTLEEHEKAGRRARQCSDLLFTLGIRGKIIAESAVAAGMHRKKVFSFTNVHELAMQLGQKIQRDDVILVKGSQGVRMERVVKSILENLSRAEDLLVRQEPEWTRRAGLYD